MTTITCIEDLRILARGRVPRAFFDYADSGSYNEETFRANRADLAVRAEGPDADRWLDIAQAFAGPPGAGRAPKGEAR